MLESGFVRVYRSILKWEWYDDTNTKAVFLHLILTANYEPKKWHGITIQRGQRVCSYGVLAKELKISEKSIRTAINHLKRTGEVAHSATPNYGVFTVLNYELYQQPADQAAPDGHPDSMNNLLTDENSEKNGHTNGQTTGTVQTQSASQKFVCQESERAPEQSPDGHPTGTRAAPDGQQWKKAKESNKAKEPPIAPHGGDEDPQGESLPVQTAAGTEKSADHSTTLEDRFNRFWKAYPKKVGKGAAECSFKKFKPDTELLNSMLKALEIQRRSDQWNRDGGQYIPNPATWLNQKRWEDEPPSGRKDDFLP